MKKILLVGLSLLMACPTFAKIKLPALVGSNMVLQREREVNLWGEASPSKKVTVTTSWDGRKYTTQSDSDGKWLLKVSTPAAGGPYTIRISDGDPVTLENVMIGEVWVCSGQSNMQMSMTGNLGEPVDGGVEALIEAPKYKDIRLFYTPMVTSPQPVDTCGGEWKVSSSESVAPFSAAAYFFARDLNDALGVPVGLIQTAWGGTRIEAWMPEATAREVEADIVQTNDRFENPNKVGYLYNAMIRPLLNMTARGFIWYQGESNVHTNNYPHYAHYMEKLVSQWLRGGDRRYRPAADDRAAVGGGGPDSELRDDRYVRHGQCRHDPPFRERPDRSPVGSAGPYQDLRSQRADRRESSLRVGSFRGRQGDSAIQDRGNARPEL